MVNGVLDKIARGVRPNEVAAREGDNGRSRDVPQE
jgi:hypothetical protein